MLFASPTRIATCFAAITCGVFFAAGCKPAEQISQYTTPKPHLVDTAAKKPGAESSGQLSEDRQMLGAIWLAPETGWFFKVMGPPEKVVAAAKEFVAFVKSIKQAAGDNPVPQWTLPAGWHEKPGDQIRFATILMGGESPLELTVTKLPRNDSDETAYLLANINRWRGQLQLPPLAAGELAQNSLSEKIAGHSCTLVNFVGKAAGGGMAGAPFANAPFAGGAGVGPLVSRRPPLRDNPPGGDGAPHLSFQTPAGWEDGQRSEMRKAAFVVQDGKEKVEITVMTAGGDLEANVERWRGQLQLPPAEPGEIAKLIASLDGAGLKWKYVNLAGPESAQPREAILGAIAEAGGQTWFVKLKGNHDLAQREKPRFEAFVKSLKIE